MAARLLKKLGIYTAGFLLGVPLLIGVLLWLAGTEPALRWAARQAEGLSGGELSLHAIHGSLYGPLRIESLGWQSAGMRVEAKEIMLDWSAGALLSRHLQITRLDVQELKVIRSKPATEPARLPETLRLPLSFSAPDIRLARLRLKLADGEQLLTNIRLGADSSGEHYQLTLHSLDSEWGKAEASMLLGDTRPYPLSAHASLQQAGRLSYRAEADASGTLAELLLKARVVAQQGQAEIKATLTPFDEFPFTAAHMTAVGVNPSLLDRRLPATSLNAEISLTHKGAKGIEGHAMLRHNRRGMKGKSAAGSLALHGTLALDEHSKFHLAGTLKKINPAEFGNYPSGAINASFSAAGYLAKIPQARLDFAVTDSHLRQQPLSAHGKLSLSATHIWNSDVMLQLAHNRAQLSGSLGKPDDTLAFSIEADNLAAFAPELGGQVRAKGTLHGKFSAPSVQGYAHLKNLSWGKDYRVASLQATARLDPGLDGALALDASLLGMVTPQLQLDRASLSAQGTRTQHTLAFTATNPDLDFETSFAGGWHNETGWSGQLTDLRNRGHYAFALKSPAQMEINRQRFLLNNATVHLADADVVLHELAYREGQLNSRGEFKNLPLAYFQDLSARTAELKTDLRLNGKWQFALGDSLDGYINLWRERGDVLIPTAPQTALGLNKLSLNIEAIKNHLHGSLEAAGSHLGSLGLDAQSVLSRRDGVWGIAGNAPVSAHAHLAIESLAWIAPLLDQTGSLSFDGALKAELDAAGSLAQPRLAGSLSGERFRVALQNQGLNLSEGRFQVDVRDHELLLKHLAMRGGEGYLSGSGRLTLEGEASVMQLALTADKLEVLSRPDRHLILSGSGNAYAANKKLQIDAKLKADRGWFELPKDSEISASDDVIVLGLEPGMAREGLPYAASFNLDLDLGERFFVKGKGLDAQLGGALKLSGKDGAYPSARGNIHVIKGTYTAYGQRLVVERGILNFQGPLDNPGLNIIAMRKNQSIEAGVSVSGTAQSTHVKLVSNPDVPDSEKLSWLVLGYGLESSSGKDINALNAAAGVLLAAGESITMQQKIAHKYGLEEVSLRGSGELEGTVLSLGKRLSSRAYLNYERGLTNASSLVKINYTLSKRVSVQAQAGTTPAVDLFYTFRFD